LGLLDILPKELSIIISTVSVALTATDFSVLHFAPLYNNSYSHFQGVLDYFKISIVFSFIDTYFLLCFVFVMLFLLIVVYPVVVSFLKTSITF